MRVRRVVAEEVELVDRLVLLEGHDVVEVCQAVKLLLLSKLSYRRLVAAVQVVNLEDLIVVYLGDAEDAVIDYDTVISTRL